MGTPAGFKGSNKGMFQAFALVWQMAQNGRIHKTDGTYSQSCMYPTGSAWPAFPMPFLLLLPASGHLSHGFPVPPAPHKALRYTHRHLPSAVPWIFGDSLLKNNKQCCTSLFINLSARYLDAATIYNYKSFALTLQFLTTAVTTMLHCDQT